MKTSQKWVILGIKTCEVFHCFLAFFFLGSIVLTSQLTGFFVLIVLRHS